MDKANGRLEGGIKSEYREKARDEYRAVEAGPRGTNANQRSNG